MADSDSLRTRRYRRHKRGDHSLCARCDAVRALIPLPELPDPPRVRDLASGGATEGDVDTQAALEGLARRLEAAHEADPANANLARELRATLLALRGPEQAADGDLAAFLAEFASASA